MRGCSGSDDPDMMIYQSCLEKLVRTNKEIVLLSILAEKPMCGYDLIKEIFSRSDVFLGQGLVYPLLYTLEEEGILRVEYTKDDKRSKIYFLTPKGEEIADKKIRSLIEATEYLLYLIKKGCNVQRSVESKEKVADEI